jgi:hypothetical protein
MATLFLLPSIWFFVNVDVLAKAWPDKGRFKLV